MIFSLEALQAFHGDSLLLHVDDRLALIDGGPVRTWATSLRPRLDQLKGDREALSIDLAMVSHLAEDQRARPYEIADLWHNAFDDVLGNRASEVPRAGAPVVASVAQGRTLRDQAVRLGWARNEAFGGALVAGPREVPFGGATLTVVAPDTGALERLDAEWEDYVARHPAPAQVAEYADRSVFNLSSIVVLAEAAGKRMLLCGDARGDRVLEGLETAGAAQNGVTQLDLLKLPHHGSIRNVDPDFFRRLPARHYVISADGRNGNPETATLEAIAASRADDDFEIHLTNHDGEDDLALRLDAFVAARDAAGRRFAVSFRDPAALSLRIDLAEPPPEEP